MIRPCKNCKANEAAPEHSLCRKCSYSANKAAKKYYWADHERGKAIQRKYRERLRDAAFEAYGGAFCKCCGNTWRECLQMDHINGGGNKHLESLNNGRNPLHLVKEEQISRRLSSDVCQL